MPPLIPLFERRLNKALSLRGVNVAEAPQPVRQAILELSGFYLRNPGAPTPWSDPVTATAYLSYFLPLNYARLVACFREVKRFLPTESVSEIWDFGSGLGTTQWVLEDEESLVPRPFYTVERAPEARAIYGQLMECEPTRWQATFADGSKRPIQSAALGVFSYSFLEMQASLPDFQSFSHLLIVEPSMRDVGRALMQWRATLQAQGFTPLAPCTHEHACPLLVHSTKDWCHRRIPFSGPSWWHALESVLPMKNRTLTFSYLLMSRTVEDQAWRGAGRAIGDTLEENGKTRQMVCRGERREFISWLHRHGPAPRIPHGALIHGLELAEIKGGGSELRPAPGSLQWSE